MFKKLGFLVVSLHAIASSQGTFFNPDIRYFGCIVTRADPNGGPPIAAVSSTASEDQCAQFRRYLAIYFAGPPGDTSPETLFFEVTDREETDRTLRPSNAVDYDIYAEYDSGEMNIKGAGFKVYLG
ncbi:hypothetical protein CVT26_003649 [Gymnopilus dilepis]|uniref:Uncharacterized protein n=1 Tax=Gymnopilus dilepis TaxID=231916 RepID=A0A409VSJ5_9AGAR|nr:hypothetical protein CVT26_003649 [Gymnopilus dilepis]